MISMDVVLEIRHLKLLAAVAEAGSITAAGRRLNLTQPALSHQLRDAEERLGTALFLRVKKKLILTAAGEDVLASSRRVLDELECVEGRVRGLKGGATGVIRLSTECYTCYHWLPPVLKAFHGKFPGVEVRIDLEATQRTVAALLEGKLDVAIVSSEPRDRALGLELLFEDEQVVVMAPGHRLARREYVRPQDLVAETLLVYPPREQSLLFQRVLGPAGIEPRKVMQVPLTEAMLELVRAGLGVAFVARWALHTSAGLVTRPLTRTGFHRRWNAATLRGTERTAPIAEFLRLLSGIGEPFQIRRRA